MSIRRANRMIFQARLSSLCLGLVILAFIIAIVLV